MGGGFIIGVIGVVILSHAAYSTIHYRSLLKITEEEFSGPPFNVVDGVASFFGFVHGGCFDCAWKIPVNSPTFR